MSNTIEKSVIGALLIEPDSISGIYEQIKPEMFGDLFCRSVYTEIVRAYDVGKSISLEELAQKLQSEGQTQEYIVQELRGIIPTVESYRIKSYADELMFRKELIWQLITGAESYQQGSDREEKALKVVLCIKAWLIPYRVQRSRRHRKQ